MKAIHDGGAPLLSCPQRRATQMGAALAAIFIAWAVAIVPLESDYYLDSFDADSAPLIDYSMAFARYMESPTQVTLPQLERYPPYFDGAFIIYGFATDLAKQLRRIGVIPQKSIPTERSVAIFAIRNLNVLCDLIAAVLLFFASLEILQNVSVASTAAFFSLFSWQLLSIDFLRMDHLVLALFTALLFIVLRSGREGGSWAIGVLTVIVAAMLTCTKASSVALALPSLAVAIWKWNRQRLGSRDLIKLGMLGFLFMSLLSIRYISTPVSGIWNLWDKALDVRRWSGALSVRPYMYYLVYLFNYNGYVCTSFALAGATLAMYLCLRHRGRDLNMVLIAVSFAGYGAFSIFAYKYPRGGYQLIPIYGLCWAVVFAFVEPELARSRLARGVKLAFRTGLPLGALAIFLLSSEPGYSSLRNEARHLDDAIVITRIEPEKWLEGHFPAGTRILIPVDSEWTMPRFSEEKFVLSHSLLDFPYLDRACSSAFVPPSIILLMRSTDVVVLNDFHPEIYIIMMRRMGLDAQAMEWVRFVNDTLSKFPQYEFRSETPCNSVRRVRIIVINDRRLVAALPKPARLSPLAQ